jgi:uncharacterized protein (TIGR03437 family)
MVNRKSFLLAALCLTVFATVSQAITSPTVFVLPNGQGGTSDICTAYTADPFGLVASVHADPSANQVFETPSGSKYYILAYTGVNAVSSFNGSLTAAASTQIGFTSAVKAAAMATTPSYVHLLVLTGDGFLHVIDTATDSEITKVSVGAGPVDVAVSQDGKTAYVLVATQLVAVNLTTNALVSSSGVPALGQLTGVAVAPNGLVYVSETNLVAIVDGRSMTQIGSISLNALPGKLVFTPDGNSALAVNQTPNTGSALLMFNLLTGTLANSVPSFGTTFTKLVVASNSVAFGISSTSPGVYQIPLPSLNLTVLNSVTGVTDIAASHEYPITPTGTGAKFLYVATNSNTIYRVDPVSGLSNSSQTSPNAAGAVAYLNSGFTGIPANLIVYNATQSVTAGSLSLPLVVRVLDANGKPLYGVTVTFSTNGGTLQATSATTNPDGIAATALTAPSTVGTTSTVTAQVGSAALQTSFAVTVPSGTTPPGGGTGSIQIQMVSGNGQVVEYPYAPVSANPLVVQVIDAQGNPLPNQTVTWSVLSGLAYASSSQSTTDANGLASTTAVGNGSNPGIASSFLSIIEASIPTGSVNFDFTTLGQTLFGTEGGLLVELNNPPQTNRTITGAAGQTIVGAIQVLVDDFNGNAIANIGLAISTGLAAGQGPTAACNAPGGTPLTDGTGNVSCDVVLGSLVGQAVITAVVGGQITMPPITLTVTPGPPSKFVVLQGNNQSGNPGQTLPAALKAQITDVGGNPLPGVPVQWTVASGTATLSNVVSTSDANGIVSALVTLGSSSVPVQVNLTALSGKVSTVFNETVNVVVGGLQAVSGGGQSAVANMNFLQPLIVVVNDSKGNPLPGETVDFTVSSGSATLTATSAVTDANGRASVAVTAGTPGPVVITATLNNLSVVFNLTVTAAGPGISAGSFLNGAGFQPGVVPGGVVYISGTGLAPGIQGSVVPNSIVGPLPTSLANVQVLFGTIPAPIFAVSNINGQQSVVVQAPFELTPGQISVTVNTAGGGSASATVQVLAYQPGIFQWVPSNGASYGVVLRPDGSFVSPSNPALRGETVQMFVTGMGQVTPAAATNDVGTGEQNVPTQVIVGVNNGGVTPISVVYAQDRIGVYIVTFQIPPNTTPGAALPLALAEGPYSNLVFGNGSLIAVQ